MNTIVKNLKRTIMKYILNLIVFHWNSMWNIIHYRHIVKKATHLHKVTGKQYYVILIQGNRLQVVNSDMVKENNKLKNKNQRLTMKQISEIAYYKTPIGKLN